MNIVELEVGLRKSVVNCGFSPAVVQCLHISATKDNRYRVVVEWLEKADSGEV